MKHNWLDNECTMTATDHIGYASCLDFSLLWDFSIFLSFVFFDSIQAALNVRGFYFLWYSSQHLILICSLIRTFMFYYLQEITPLAAEDDKHGFSALLFSVILFSSSREIS